MSTPLNDNDFAGSDPNPSGLDPKDLALSYAQELAKSSGPSDVHGEYGHNENVHVAGNLYGNNHQTPPPGYYANQSAQTGPNPDYFGVIHVQPRNIAVLHQEDGRIEDISDYQCFAWVTCLLCCWCIGLCAIMSSQEVRDAKLVGDYRKAYAASKKALGLSIGALVIGLLVLVSTTAWQIVIKVGQ